MEGAMKCSSAHIDHKVLPIWLRLQFQTFANLLNVIQSVWVRLLLFGDRLLPYRRLVQLQPLDAKRLRMLAKQMFGKFRKKEINHRSNCWFFYIVAKRFPSCFYSGVTELLSGWNAFRFWAYLLNILPFGDVLISNLHSGIAEAFQQICRVQAHQIRCFISHCRENRRI